MERDSNTRQYSVQEGKEATRVDEWLLRRARLVNHEQPCALRLTPDYFSADAARRGSRGVKRPARVQHRQPFAGLDNRAGFQLHLTTILEKALVGVTDGFMPDCRLTADDQHCARLIQSHQTFDVSPIESIEEKSVDFRWGLCGHSSLIIVARMHMTGVRREWARRKLYCLGKEFSVRSFSGIVDLQPRLHGGEPLCDGSQFFFGT